MLQRPAVGKGETPGRAAELVQRIQVRRGKLVALAAREEGDAGHCRGDRALEAAQRALGHFLHARLPGAVLA